jgi:rhodanese-related sulfurtransferase
VQHHFYTILVITILISCGNSQSVAAESCCDKAQTKNQFCKHECCIEAQKSNLLCKSCNPDAVPSTPIFDGKTLDGWGSYGDGRPVRKGWSAKEGALACQPGGGDIMTTEAYDNVELQFDWKISPGGNSGVMYRVDPRLPKPFLSGPEYQVFDDKGQPNSNVMAGALYAMVVPEGKKLNPVGEYNHGRIVLQGNHLEHWLNGRKVVEIEMHGDRWNDLVAASKFKKWPSFGKAPQGHIVLQDHGNPVWYRNITVRPLPPQDTAGLLHISTHSAEALIRSKREGLQILDVRTAGEYARGHVPNCQLLDFRSRSFREKLATLDKEQPYIVYCASGGRSASALNMMGGMGFTKAYNVLGGFRKWSAEDKTSEH